MLYVFKAPFDRRENSGDAVVTRSYGQACLVARAMDVLGERWTLLIVRQLGLGPQRFSELLGALDGIGTNLLSERLKHLQIHDVVAKTVIGDPGSSHAYVLTERGEQLTPVIATLVDWAAALPPAPRDFQRRAEWALLAMKAAAVRSGASFDTVTELHIDGEVFWLYSGGGHTQLRTGPAPLSAGLVLSCSTLTLQELASGLVSVADAMARGDLRVDGDRASASEFFEVFRIPAGPALSAARGRRTAKTKRL